MNPDYLPLPTTCEHLARYNEGGLHPVVIGDSFQGGQYVTVHKLGFGGFGTIWLARDIQQNRYVALKILTAHVSKDCHELQILQKLTGSGAEDAKPSHIVPLLDHFQIHGPNGTHTCLVLPFLGPSIASPQPNNELVKIRPDVSRKLAWQTATAVSQIRERGISLGDVSASNILLRRANVDHLSTEEIYELLGKPETYDMKRRMGANYKHKPEYFYGPIERGRVKADLLLQEITLIDMGEAVLLDVAAETKTFGYNLCYAAPEFHFGGQRSKASDIWALACCVFEVRSGRQLFAEGFSGLFGMMIRMTETIGPLPRHWLEQKITTAPNIIERIDERARTVAKGKGDHSLKARVEAIGKWNTWCHWSPEERLEKLVEFERYHTRKSTEEELQREINRGHNPHGPLSQEEVSDFMDLLSKMLKYDPEERITIEEVLEHPWLNRSYEDVLEWTGPWMQECDTGRSDWNEDELA